MGETGTDTPLEAARRMLDIFASVGAERFHVTWTDSAAHPRRPRSLRRNLRSLGGPLPQTENEDWLDAVHIAGIGAADLARTIPALLDTATADRLNLTVRPRGTGVRFIQLDDLAAEKLPALAAAMFLILETSPGNHQAWLAMPGQHDAPPEHFAPVSPRRRFSHGTDKWPIYAKALAGAPRNRDGSGPDRSRADYWWCFLAIQWGHGVDDTAAHLLQESPKAREEGKSYALHTARQAEAAVERRRQQQAFRPVEHVWR